MNLGGIDLNLLVVLDALLVEQHVTRAARRVGLSQPAMSNALGRLRRLLGDPILVPGVRRKLVPTARAHALAAPLHRILGELGDALDPAPPFAPERTRRAFTLVTNDYMQAAVLVPLARRLSAEAPFVDLVLQPPFRYADWDAVLSGGADAALLPVGDTELPRGLHRRTLLIDPFVCIVRRGHPRVSRRLTLKTYLSLPHVVVSPGGVGGPSTVDKAIGQLGASRRVGLKVAFFNVAPLAVASTDFVATLPASLAHVHLRRLGLRAFPPPIEVPPVEHSLFWHDRTEHAAEHAWLRERIFAVASEAASRAKRSFTR
ncbi:LysR family transcriptional regulator [Pendulispora albinea]|uniref:LysR family transcriptional regulator n=1 Tax=Pendulispora albinea TaxID=2741071 RepID=A0ABZ2MAY3_9BACT